MISRALTRRSFLLFATLALYGAALGAQAVPARPDSAGVVVGTVRSWNRGRTVARAIVTLERVEDARTPALVQALSDSTGRFLLRVPASGRYLLLARALHAEASGSTHLPVHVRGGDTVRIDVFIPPYGFDPARRQAQLDTLAENQARWSNHRPAVYRATIGWSCFCLGGGVGEWTLEVGPDSTVVLQTPRDGGPRPPIMSVDSLFEWLKGELRDPDRGVTVRYDAVLGYPADIHTDTIYLFTDSWTRVQLRGVVSVPASKPKRSSRSGARR